MNFSCLLYNNGICMVDGFLSKKKANCNECHEFCTCLYCENFNNCYEIKCNPCKNISNFTKTVKM